MSDKTEARKRSRPQRRPVKKTVSKSAAKSRLKKARRKKSGVVMLAGGNPKIAKADGDAPVQAYISAIQDWKRAIAKRIDAVIENSVPNVRKAVKWNSPFYGADGRTWFLGFHVFTNYVKVTFFRGGALQPLPPGSSKNKDVRHLDIHEGEFDESQFKDWVRQAAKLPGWAP